MKKRTTAVLLASAFLFSLPAMAEPLTGPQIEEKLSGKRVYLSTGYGVEFPMIYNTNGRVTGDGTGTRLGNFFAPKETGKWWVKGDQMCQQFPTWYKGRTLCFELIQETPNSLIWKRTDGKSGKARIG